MEVFDENEQPPHHDTEEIVACSGVPLDYLGLIRTNIESADVSNKLLGMVGFRTWIENATQADAINLQNYIKDLLPRLLDFIHRKMEALKAIFKILGVPALVNDVVSKGCIQMFTDIVKDIEGNASLTILAIMCLTIIAGHDIKSRDVILKERVIIPFFLHLKKHSQNQELLTAVLSCLRAFLKGRPRVDLDSVKEMFPLLIDQLDKKAYLRHKEDVLFLVERLTEFKGGSSFYFEIGLVKRIIALFDRSEDWILNPALKALANCIDGSITMCEVHYSFSPLKLQKIFDEFPKLADTIGSLLESKDEKVLLRCAELLQKVSSSQRCLFKLVRKEKTISSFLSTLARGGSPLKKELLPVLSRVNEGMEREQASSLFGDLFVSIIWDMATSCNQETMQLTKAWLAKINAEKDFSNSSRRLWGTLNNAGLFNAESLPVQPHVPAIVFLDLTE